MTPPVAPEILYKQLAEIPAPTSAVFLPNGDGQNSRIRVTSTVRDHVRIVSRASNKTYIVGHDADGAVMSGASEPQVGVVLSGWSACGTLVAYLREEEQKGSIRRFVEVWRDSVLVVVKEVTASHAEFYTDEFFSSLSFAPSGKALVYTAEDLPPTDDSRFTYRPTFGERLAKRCRPTLFVLQWSADGSEGDLTFLKPRFVHLGQAVFASDSVIIARGFQATSDGRLLGIVGCTNRPSSIWTVTVHEGTSPKGPLSVPFKQISSAAHSARSPRVCRGRVVWLANPVGGPHASCATLFVYDTESGKTTQLCSVIQEPAIANGYPGLFADYIAPSAFINAEHESASVLLTTIWGTRKTVLQVPLSGGPIVEITLKERDGDVCSWVLLATDGGRRFVCARSSPTQPPEVVLCTISANGRVVQRILAQPVLSNEVQNALKSITVSIERLPDRWPVETIVVQPLANANATTKAPCILIPHGGPHLASTTQFDVANAAFAAAGYTLSLINYTGSTGYGQKYIEQLLGRCGDLDVKDCKAMQEHLVKIRVAEHGPGKHFILGGSHGGFIAGHLVSKNPTFFSACSLRNPVVAVGDMFSASDVPDWAFHQFAAGASPAEFASGGHIPSPEDYRDRQAKSPLAHAKQIRVPVLLLVGDADARVPMSQAKALYHALKAAGRLVEMLVFPGAGHALSGVEVERVSWKKTLDWFAAAGAKPLNA